MKPTIFQISEDLLKAAKHKALDLGISFAELVRRAIKQFLERS